MNLGNMEKVVVEKLDVSEYVGTKANIENVTVEKTQYGEAIKVSSVVLATIETDGDKKNIELRASKMFSVKDGAVVVDGKLDKFMQKHNVDQPLKLIGKEILVITNEKDFLTFN